MTSGNNILRITVERRIHCARCGGELRTSKEGTIVWIEPCRTCCREDSRCAGGKS